MGLGVLARRLTARSSWPPTAGAGTGTLAQDRPLSLVCGSPLLEFWPLLRTSPWNLSWTLLWFISGVNSGALFSGYSVTQLQGCRRTEESVSYGVSEMNISQQELGCPW